MDYEVAQCKLTSRNKSLKRKTNSVVTENHTAISSRGTVPYVFFYGGGVGDGNTTLAGHSCTKLFHTKPFHWHFYSTDDYKCTSTRKYNPLDYITCHSISLRLCLLKSGGHFKNTYELLNLRALKFSPVDKIYIFQCMGKMFLWNFKGTLWNSTQNIWPIHWRICFLYNIETLRVLIFNSSYVFLKCPPGHVHFRQSLGT